MPGSILQNGKKACKAQNKSMGMIEYLENIPHAARHRKLRVFSQQRKEGIWSICNLHREGISDSSRFTTQQKE